MLTDTYLAGTQVNAAVRIAPGSSATIPIRFFSYGPLTAPIEITVVQTNSNAINALVFSLDRKTGLNGTVANLTITAPATAFTGNQNFASFNIISQNTAGMSSQSQGSYFPGLATN